MPFAPGAEGIGDTLPVCLGVFVAVDRGLHLPGIDPHLAVPLAIALEQRLAQRREVLPPDAQCIDIAVGDTAVQVGVEVVQVLRLTGIDVARDVEVVVVDGVGDFGHRHHARVARQLGPSGEDVHDLVDVLRAEAVLGAVLEEAPARIDHEDPGACGGVFLVDDHDAGRDARAVEEVGGQADDSLDESTPDEIPAYIGLLVAAEQHPVRQDDRALALAVERRKEV